MEKLFKQLSQAKTFTKRKEITEQINNLILENSLKGQYLTIGKMRELANKYLDFNGFWFGIERDGNKVWTKQYNFEKDYKNSHVLNINYLKPKIYVRTSVII